MRWDALRAHVIISVTIRHCDTINPPCDITVRHGYVRTSSDSREISIFHEKFVDLLACQCGVCADSHFGKRIMFRLVAIYV